MIINGLELFKKAPIRNMAIKKIRNNGVSYGLSEAGYDIRIKQSVSFSPKYRNIPMRVIISSNDDSSYSEEDGNFTIASAIEEFQMPADLVGVVHDKSTWARRGLSVFNTVIEPGWNGFLTLELVYHGNDALTIPAGTGIAQILFSKIYEHADYGNGKYQSQPDKPVEAILS